MKNYIFIFLVFQTFVCIGQIHLVNPSFEEEPADATMPMGWWLVEYGTTPDILPGFWGVYTDASQGETFIGLITREDGSWEAIGQRLTSSLKKNMCYTFTIDVAHSEEYVGYNIPITLRVWIGSSKKSKDQLVYKSELIDWKEWKTIKIDFNPDADYRYIIFEAYAPASRNTGGNILLDNISAISLCNRV